MKMRYKHVPDLLEEHGPMIADELMEKTGATKHACKDALRRAHSAGLVERRYRVEVDVIAGTYEYYIGDNQ